VARINHRHLKYALCYRGLSDPDPFFFSSSLLLPLPFLLSLEPSDRRPPDDGGAARVGIGGFRARAALFNNIHHHRCRAHNEYDEEMNAKCNWCNDGEEV
jgi:hypothetical protein